MRCLRLIPLSLTSGVLLCGVSLLAQNSTISPRITAEVDEASLTTLHGNVPRMARAEFDRGEAAPATELSHVRLVLARSAAQQAALDAYLAQLQDPASPNYHKWLTPSEFGRLYGPADADVATLVSWLQSQGFSVDPVPDGRTDISFSGTVSQIEAAFHTTIHNFQANGVQFYSNTTDPQIPSALAPVVAGVAQLNTIRPTPQLVPGGAGRFNAQTGQMEPAASAQTAPGLTGGSSSAGYFLYMTPADAATIYDTPNSFNANFSGTSYTGTGVKIGIGGAATISGSIVADYRSRFLGNSTQPTIYYCTGSTFSSCSSTPASPVCSGTSTSGCYDNTDDADEAYLDTELAGGMAPGATIYYYASTDLFSGVEAAIQQDAVNIFSLSFGSCEQDMSTSDNLQVYDLWQQAAGEGIAVTVSTGDTGSASCDGDATSAETVAQYGLSVNGLASTPYNIAVGGTDFYPLVNYYSSYVSTSEGSSSTYYRTALGYIPESTWNDSSYNDTTISNNEPLSAVSGYTTSDNNIVAGSGGHSSCSTNHSVDTSNGVTDGSCVSGYAKPTWQTGTGTYDTDSVRDIPDVSLMSGNGFDAATWLVCTADTYKSSGTTYPENCATQSNGYFYFTGFGGTSTAAPAFAGILALVEQKTGSRMGQAAQTLYELYNGSHANAIFHDVTVGNNSVYCTSGTPNCTTADSLGYYFESGYNTGTGYDLATGMGSVDATNLVNYWSTASGSSSTFSLSASSPASISPGASATSTITVTGENSYAGTVTLTCELTSYPSGADYLPSCSGGSSTVALSSSTTSGTATVTVDTTAATSEVIYPKLPGSKTPGKDGNWLGAGGGAVLAFLVFLGIPARRRGWRSMLGVLVLLATLGALSACSGGSTTTTTGTSGTTAGTYTFTVTGTGNDADTTKATATFSVTVN